MGVFYLRREAAQSEREDEDGRKTKAQMEVSLREVLEQGAPLDLRR
jgi:hypothetical protein